MPGNFSVKRSILCINSTRFNIHWVQREQKLHKIIHWAHTMSFVSESCVLMESELPPCSCSGWWKLQASSCSTIIIVSSPKSIKRIPGLRLNVSYNKRKNLCQLLCQFYVSKSGRVRTDRSRSFGLFVFSFWLEKLFEGT